ncbi:tropomyosin-1 isoform X7 [Patella vulgata]|uniref:tropomyosin-1 isoform X7 n=1 Tax=Patella vulgata TaxID=6465 RepID=UPI00217F7978|nr:tropomyosin-1 isoform X7 [Patella vulgata]
MLIGCDEMGENLLSVPEPDYAENVELSQDSQLSAPDLSQGSVDSVPLSDGIKTKKRQGSKKVKKKKSKSKSKDGEKSDKSESKKSRTSRRPEPEGAPPSVANMDEYDRIIYSDEPIFSDVDISADEGISVQKERPERPRSSRPQRQSKNGGIFIPVCSQLGLNSNTMIKFAIIGTELQNVVRISLKRLEAEAAGFSRRITLLEEDLERSEERLTSAQSKLEEASKAADESERGRKVLESRSLSDDERIDQLEAQLKEAKYIAEDAERKYDEAARKLAITEVDLERAETRLEAAEAKIYELDEELHVLGNNLKTYTVQVSEASQREDSYEETIRDLTNRLKDAELRNETAERELVRLQASFDHLEDQLDCEKRHSEQLARELEKTMQDLQDM